MLKFACRITGDDYQMLKSETHLSKKKVIVMALSVFVPTILWFVNGLLLAYAVLDKPFGVSFLVGITAALLIFLIEKLIVMSNGSLALTIFRGILAFLVAILGSVFMDEVIFDKDINQQVTLNQNALLEKKQQEVRNKYAGEISKMDLSLTSKYNSWQSTQIEAQREADGSGGSGVKGVDAITKLKLENAAINQVDYQSAKSEKDLLNQKILDEQKQIKDEISSSFEESAMLIRIKAMFDLALSDVFMGAIYSIVTLILFGLEFIVIIFKVTMKKTNYEYQLELIEEIGQKRREKIRNNDMNHFEHAKAYPVYKNASNALLKSHSSSMFN